MKLSIENPSKIVDTHQGLQAKIALTTYSSAQSQASEGIRLSRLV
jgi:hypothetical protein